MATFSYTPSYTSKSTSTPRLTEAAFNTQYEYAIFDGINYDLKKWDLTFEGLSASKASAITNFFTDNDTAIAPFTWTDPDGNASNFICKTWQRTFVGVDTATVTCAFEEVPYTYTNSTAHTYFKTLTANSTAALHISEAII